jgi:RHS repeat-associated protein
MSTTPRGRAGWAGAVILTAWSCATATRTELDGARRTSASEERRYYCQNWRADVSVILPSTGCDASSGPGILEWIKYSAYGVPQAFSMADYNRDGVKNSSDYNGTTGDFDVDYANSDPRADVNFDGGVTIDDLLLLANAASEAAGRGTQSCASTANRIGYAGYVWDPAVIGANHVRHRVYLPELGRWTRRDPLGYVDGMGLYEYVTGKWEPSPLPVVPAAESICWRTVIGETAQMCCRTLVGGLLVVVCTESTIAPEQFPRDWYPDCEEAWVIYEFHCGASGPTPCNLRDDCEELIMKRMYNQRCMDLADEVIRQCPPPTGLEQTAIQYYDYINSCQFQHQRRCYGNQ